MRRAAVALALVLAVAGCGGGNGDEAGEAPAAADGPAENGCRQVEAPPPGQQDAPTAPAEPLDPEAAHRLLFETSCGALTVELDPEAAPQTTASLVSLAGAGFFDGTVFHRVVPGFVIQGGDPTGTGSGGPGYSTVDEPPAGARYTAGVVAMAKTAADPPGTSGSQFFVVTADDAELEPVYAVVGRVVEGMETVRRIEALGDAQTQQPERPIVIDAVTVETSG